MKSLRIQAFSLFSALFFVLASEAKPPRQVIEMDGKPISEKESLELIYHRTDYDVLADFKEIRWNGKVLDSVVVDRDRYLSVLVDVGQVEEVRSSRGRTVGRIKLQKIGLICTDKIISVQGDFHLKPHVRLFPGTSVIFKLDDDPLRESGNLIKLFVCPPNEKSAETQVFSSPNEHLPPPPAKLDGVR